MIKSRSLFGVSHGAGVRGLPYPQKPSVAQVVAGHLPNLRILAPNRFLLPLPPPDELHEVFTVCTARADAPTIQVVRRYRTPLIPMSYMLTKTSTRQQCMSYNCSRLSSNGVSDSIAEMRVSPTAWYLGESRRSSRYAPGSYSRLKDRG